MRKSDAMKKIEYFEGIDVYDEDNVYHIKIPKQIASQDDLKTIVDWIEKWYQAKKESEREVDVSFVYDTPETNIEIPLDLTTSFKKILVIDDFAASRRVVKMMLINEMKIASESTVFEAHDGKEALDILKSQPDFDLVISDWNMPILNGLELLVEMRRLDPLKDIPFIMLTAEGSISQVKKALKAGVNNYIIKPFKCETLYHKLRQINFI